MVGDAGARAPGRLRGGVGVAPAADSRAGPANNHGLRSGRVGHESGIRERGSRGMRGPFRDPARLTSAFAGAADAGAESARGSARRARRGECRAPGAAVRGTRHPAPQPDRADPESGARGSGATFAQERCAGRR